MNLPQLGQPLKAVRDCNGCAECCKSMDAKRADGSWKAAGSWCENVCEVGNGRGCSDYDNRWQSCRDFVCLWAAGLIPEELWPDRTRIIFSATSDGQRVLVIEDKDRPRSSERGATGRFLDRVLESGVEVIRICGGQRTLIRKSQ